MSSGSRLPSCSAEVWLYVLDDGLSDMEFPRMEVPMACTWSRITADWFDTMSAALNESERPMSYHSICMSMDMEL